MPYCISLEKESLLETENVFLNFVQPWIRKEEGTQWNPSEFFDRRYGTVRIRVLVVQKVRSVLNSTS